MKVARHSRKRARALITQNDPDAVRAGLAEIAAALDAVSPASLFYGRAIGTAMQALQVLLAVPFLHLQLWQNAMWGRSTAERGARSGIGLDNLAAPTGRPRALTRRGARVLRITSCGRALRLVRLAFGLHLWVTRRFTGSVLDGTL